MGYKKTKLDFDQLRIEIQALNNRKALYRLLKEELGKLGHWKQHLQQAVISDNPIDYYYENMG